MNVEIIDQQYSQLQAQTAETVASLKELAAKLQKAADNGDQNAREWLLDLKGTALSFQAEQNSVMLVFQALHNFIATETHPVSLVPQVATPAFAEATASPAPAPSPSYQQPQAYQQPHRGFLNSGFGQAIAMGAGFALGDDLINSIF